MIFRDDDFVAFYPRIHDGQHFTDQRDGFFLVNTQVFAEDFRAPRLIVIDMVALVLLV